MKKYFLLFLVGILTVNSFAQGRKLSEKLPQITSIDIDGDITINLIYDKNNHMEGSVPEDQEKFFSWNVTDSTTLAIRVKKPVNLGNNQPLTHMKIDVYVSDLKDIKCKRGSSIISDFTIESRIFTIDISRNSVVSIPIKCFDLTAYCSYGSSLTLNGKSDFVVIESSFGAVVNNRDLQTESSTVTASTNSEVYVKATKKLLLTAKKSAIISYEKGDAAVTQQEKLFGKVVSHETK